MIDDDDYDDDEHTVSTECLDGQDESDWHCGGNCGYSPENDDDEDCEHCGCCGCTSCLYARVA